MVIVHGERVVAGGGKKARGSIVDGDVCEGCSMGCEQHARLVHFVVQSGIIIIGRGCRFRCRCASRILTSSRIITRTTRRTTRSIQGVLLLGAVLFVFE